MINGIHCDVSCDEMRALLEERIVHHQEKVSFYSRSASELEANGLGETGHSRDPLRDIREKAAEHGRKVAFLTFIREHLVAGETYRLSESDLHHLGFISW
jgi:hypothetical protein